MVRARTVPAAGSTSPDVASTAALPARQYMIRLRRPSRKLTIKDVLGEFADTGVQIDSKYGPIKVDSAQGDFVVRGWATDEARAAAEKQVAAVQFFGDPRVGPTA